MKQIRTIYVMKTMDRWFNFYRTPPKNLVEHAGQIGNSREVRSSTTYYAEGCASAVEDILPVLRRVKRGTVMRIDFTIGKVQ